MADQALDHNTFRGMAQHEAEQAHRRLSWLGTFQGFLFAALGLAWGGGSKHSLLLVIAWLGLGVALLVYLAVLGTVLATIRIQRDWLVVRSREYVGPDIFGFFPHTAPWSLFIAPESLLPIAFAAAWASVLYLVTTTPALAALP